jgi:hypothetical protein
MQREVNAVAAEVGGNDGQRRRAVTPVGVVDSFKGVVVVRTPFRFPEAGVVAQDDPVDDGIDKGVCRGMAYRWTK